MSEGEYICETCGEGYDSGGLLGVHVVREHSQNRLGSPVSKEDLVRSIKDLADDLEKVPTAREMAEHGEYSHKVCQNKFGSWNAALRAAGYPPNKRNRIPESELIAEIDRLAELYDRPPSTSEMDRMGEFGRDIYFTRYGSWEEALNEAGYSKPQSYVECEGVFPYGSNWHEQRELALERDGYQCRMPNCKITRDDHYQRHSSDLHVHHIRPRKRFVDDKGDLDEVEANRLENLITLCGPHHHYWEPISPLLPDIRDD